ncbi:glycoside hydrolase family 25 protein [Sphaerisporangium sp. NPDC049002]|uniref:glycoside hydrolase family 25 protein n=1 Tax=unclassified Sphaerisporangium TaxID=2630420 RepID=UPI0033E9DE41
MRSVMLHGIDVSNWQGAVDWSEYAGGGVDFGFAKASEGTAFTDKWFARNWTGMRENWLVCGAYHFGHPKGDPDDQVRHFLNVVDEAGGLRRGDLVALDLEHSGHLPPEEVAAFARRWCHVMTRLTGVRPLIYTFLSFAKKGYCQGLDDYPLWIAAPSHPKGHPVVPPPWNRWTIHQYAHGPIDRNVFRGTRAQLTALGFQPHKRESKA